MANYFDSPATKIRSSYFDPEPAKTGVLGRLEEYGYEVPEQKGWSLFGKKFMNVLGGVMDILRSGEYAVGGLLAGKTPITGIKEKISPSEVLFQDREEERKLWSKRGIAALAVDILLDPVTYLTFGTGGVMKLSTKGGQIALSKTGRQLMKTMITKGASEATARRTMAKVIQRGGEKAALKYIAKDGLKFMGQTFIPRKYFEMAGKTINKLPGAGTTNKIGNAFSRAFVPFREIDMLPAKVGGKGMYTDFLYKPYVRETQSQIFKEIDNMKAIAQKAYKQYGNDIGKELAYKVERGTLTGDAMLDTIIKAQQRDHKIMLQIEKATGKKIGEIENYLRHYLTPEGRKLIQKQGDIMSLVSKPLRAKLGAATPRKIPGIISEINTEIAKKHPAVKNFFEPDMFKSWALRKIEHIKYINTHKFLENTKARFGVRLDRSPAGRITEEGIKLVESTAPQLKGYLLPEPIIRHIDDTMKFFTNEESMRGFVRIYDKLLSFWKVNVTGLWPAFHTRNFIGGSFNNWLAYGDLGIGAGKKEALMVADSIDVEKILRGSDHIINTKIGTKYTGQQVLDLAERFGAKGQPGMMDVYRSVEQSIEEITAKNIKKVGIKASNAPRWAMEFVEDRLRGPLFLRSLKEGLSPAEAAKMVFRFHFDYLPATGFTNFERNFMKRLIPFYTWTRNNVPLQLEMMMKQPGKYANLEKLRQSMFGKKEQEEFKYLPDWMKDTFTFPLPWKNELGKTLWAQLDIPLEDINYLPISSDGIRQIASALSPFLKYPLELYFNKNMYFGGNIWNPDLPKEMQTTKSIEALKILPNPIKKFLNFREVKYRDWRFPDEKKFITRYEIDAKKMHFLNTYLGRYFSTLKGVSEEDIPSEWKITRYVGGIPVRTFEVEEEKDRQEAEIEKQAQEMIRYLQQHKIIPYKSEEKKGSKYF